ncbi:hypothetical protein JY651_08095 [Pyxidicoccus parkwayensis]|uniref:Uncharacterized protein n=1 Tax=Pyxidicoccus parkwayensis TaxID=2813578 RepID=A0ABX7P356_9BACT|nr:hypothetical protein [Pyxidicoccus parkwaysis]QSQ24888.1 hypothetical protein JY651_08095 [Pyxidicoccus parkwaysis]
MTACASPQPVGELGDACQRLRALEAWWRPEQDAAIREALAEAAGIPARQAKAVEALRAAEDALARLTPDGTRATQRLWHEEQRAVTHYRGEVVALRAAELALHTFLDVETWWARKAKWAAGVAALNAMEHESK